MIDLAVEIEAGDWSRLGDAEALCRRAADAALAVLPDRPAGDLAATLLLTDDAAVRELNRRWRGQDKATDVLSFPTPALLESSGRRGVPRELGDIALACETVEREARDEGRSLADHASHLVVHGLLHLLGLDHGTDREAAIMEGLEIEALARLGIADPYLASA